MSQLPKRFTGAYALVIGVGADLPVTVRDADAVAGILRDPARCAYPLDRVRLLTETAASRDGVVAALRGLSTEVTPDDALTVYYSGHGVAAPNQKYFLLTHGADHTRLDDTALNGREFTELLLAIPARRLLLLLDCCRAGGIFDRSVGKAPDSVRPDIPVDMQMLSQGSGTVVIASSRADEISEIQRGYSVFTYVLVEALCGVGAALRDSFVYTSDLAGHTRERVPGLTNDRQHPTMTFKAADDYRVAFYAAGGTTPKGVPAGFLPPDFGISGSAMIDHETVLRAMRQLLAKLNLGFREVGLMVRDMDLGDLTIHYDDGALVYWNEILQAAHVRYRMERFFAVIDAQFGDNPEWSTLKAAYLSTRPSHPAKDQPVSSAKVLPFERPQKRAGRRAGVESASSPTGDQLMHGRS